MPRGSAPGERRGGRQKGVPNKTNRERIAAAESSGMMPHDFLLAVARGQTFDGYTPTFQERMKAATDCANYFAPKLTSTEHTNGDDGPFKIVISGSQAEY